MSQVSAWKKKAEKGIAFSSEAYGVLLVTLVSLAMLFRSVAFLSNFDPWYKGVTLFFTPMCYVPIALMGRLAPQRINLSRCLAVTLAFALAGCALWTWFFPTTMPNRYVLLCIADFLYNIARAWGGVLATLYLSHMRRPENLVICTCSGLSLAYLVHAIFVTVGGPMVFMCCFSVTLLLVMGTWKERPLFDALCTSDTPQNLEVTNPHSFVSLRSKLFTCILLFETVFGYASTLMMGSESFSNQMFIAIAFILLSLYAISHDGETRGFDEDRLFSLCGLTVLFGFLVLIPSHANADFISLALTLCSQFFYALLLSTLAFIAARNPSGALVVVPLGLGVSTFGSWVGYGFCQFLHILVGRGFTGDDAVVVGCFAFVIVAYVWVGMRGFSFTGLFASIVPVSDPIVTSVPSESSTFESDVIDLRVAEIARDTGLTPREEEIARMLARGRNSAYIQDTLVISRNTAKTHVRHVYQKIGVHSQQELIDYVERGYVA